MTLAASPPAPSTAAWRPPWFVGTLAALFGDFVSTLVFAAAYALTRGVAPALALAVAAGVGGIVWTRLRGRRVDALQGLSLGLTVALGGASLLGHDPRWVMLKPSVIYGAVGLTMLRPGWMTRYLPEVALRHGADVTRTFGGVWAGAMLALGAANLALALHGDARLWAACLAAGPLALKAGLALVQYGVTRHVVVTRHRREAAAGFTHG